jgi:acetoacetate decarboxylase
MTTIRYGARALDQEAPSAPGEAPKMWAKTLVTFYETDPEIIAAVLPQPLEPADEPHVRINIAEVDMPGTDYTLGAAVFSVRAKHEGTVGLYDLTMVMTTEQAVIGGRETFGEPKKIGQVTLSRDGDRVHGKVSRMGVDYMEVTGTVAETLEPRPLSERTSFYFKFLMDPAGKGFDSEPSLVYCYRTEEQRLLERIDAEITLRDSPFDPVVDLPVRRIVSSEYSESNTTQRGEIVSHVPAEWLLPFAHQRYDHLAQRATLPKETAAPGL